MVNNREKILPIIFTGVHQKPMPRRSCQWLIRKCTLLDVTNNNSQHMTYTLILSCLGDRSTDTQTVPTLFTQCKLWNFTKDIIGRCSRKLFVCRYHELIFTSQIGNNWWRCATDTVIWATVPSAHISIRLSLEQQRLNWISLASMSNVIDQLKLFETYLLLRQPQSLPSDSPHSQSMVYVTINYIRKTLNLPQYLHCTANWRSSLSHCYKLMFCSTFTFH